MKSYCIVKVKVDSTQMRLVFSLIDFYTFTTENPSSLPSKKVNSYSGDQINYVYEFLTAWVNIQYKFWSL